MLLAYFTSSKSPGFQFLSNHGSSGGASCLLSSPIDLQPDLALPCIGVSIEGARVVHVAIERRSVGDLIRRPDAELAPIFAKVRGEGDEASRRGELGGRVVEKLMPEVGAAP